MPTQNQKPRSKEAIHIPISEQNVRESITATAALSLSVAEAVNLMVDSLKRLPKHTSCGSL